MDVGYPWRGSNAGWMLSHRLRRWPNIDKTSYQCLLFAGYFTSACCLGYVVRGTSIPHLWPLTVWPFPIRLNPYLTWSKGRWPASASTTCQLTTKRRLPNVRLMLGQRRRHCGQWFSRHPSKHEMLSLCWFNVGSASETVAQTLNQHWLNFSCC